MIGDDDDDDEWLDLPSYNIVSYGIGIVIDIGIGISSPKILVFHNWSSQLVLNISYWV